MKKWYVLVVSFLLCISVAGCHSTETISGTKVLDSIELFTKDNSESITLEAGETYMVSNFVKGESKNAILNKDGKQTKVKKQLRINGITLGSSLDELMDTFNVSENYAFINYEYDEDKSGNTQIYSDVYDGTMVNFEEKNVLDLFIQIRYYYDGKNWNVFNYKEDKDKAFEKMLTVSFDVNGNMKTYDAWKEKQVMALSVSMYEGK